MAEVLQAKLNAGAHSSPEITNMVHGSARESLQVDRSLTLGAKTTVQSSQRICDVKLREFKARI